MGKMKLNDEDGLELKGVTLSGVEGWRMSTAFFDKLPMTALLFLLTLSLSSVFAQSSIEVIRNARVDTLVERYKEVHQKKESIVGYRIQITAGSNRTNVYQVKSQFYKLFPNITQYLVYQAPNFKLRVGNYRTRLEAFRDLEQIASEFKGAFIISDEIKISEL